jgi:hypothetical protein
MEEGARILPSVQEYLERGLALNRWWAEQRYTTQSDSEDFGPPEKDRFPLIRSFNRPNRSYGFYGEVPYRGARMPVMGNVQEMFYDRLPGSLSRDPAQALVMRDQLREFVMKYFMRVSSFRQPETFIDAATPIPPPALARLSWCPTPSLQRIGFGFKQLYVQRAGTRVIEAFPGYDRYSIVDQRTIGAIYDWLLLRVHIFNFNFSFQPFENGPDVVFAQNEQSYLVVHEEFLNHRENPVPGVLGDYGIGYAFIKNPNPGLYAFGPGEFDAAIELINFRVFHDGHITVRMIFIVNRPTGVANFTINPVDWSFELADTLSLGLTSRLWAPARTVLNQLPLKITFDPVLAYIGAANSVSGGAAARDLCISLQELEKVFLIKHFAQHYETILGSLYTWRLVPDWLDEKELQRNYPWVISGISS